MTLRAKLIGLVVGLISLMVLLAISSLMTLADTNDDFASTYNDRIVPLRQLKIVADMYAVNIVDTTHKLNHQSMDPAAAQSSYAAAKAGIAEQWKAYTATQLTDEEKVLVGKVESTMSKANDLVRQLETLAASKDIAGIDAVARQQLYPVIDPVSTAISELVDLQLREAKKSFEKAQEDYASVRTWTIIKLGLAMLIGIGIAFWIVTTMNSKIATLNRIMRQARDNNDLTLRIPQHNQDEIDSVARAYNALADNMQSLVATVAVAVDSVNSEAEQLASTSEQVAQASNLGSEATSSMAAAVEEVTVSIAHVADSAQEAHEVGESSRQKAQQGGQQIQATIERINAIDHAVASTANKVTALGKDAERITSVVSVIKDVADQTNLLALNAAIEAARAGEQGRGFAVVADEVRKLAERTANATVDIQNMVGQIGANSQQAVEAIAATVERAHECALLAGEAGEAIASITRDVDASEHAVAGIAEALHEHKAGTQQIAQQVERVAQITEENTAAVATMSQTATNLGDLTRRLHAEVRRFRYQAGGA